MVLRVSSFLKSTAFALFLLLVTRLCFGADAKGYVRPEDCSFMGNHIYLEHFRSHVLSRPLVLEVPYYLDAMPKDFVDVPGRRCADRAQCESAVSSKVQILRVSHRWPHRGHVAGNFQMEFPDGAKFNGSFEVKPRRRDQSLICE